MNRSALFIAALVTASGAHAQLAIDWYTIDGGGGRSSGGSLELTGTIGQPDAGMRAAVGSLELTGGFWRGIQVGGEPCAADLTSTNTNPGAPGYGSPDGVLDGADLSYFVESWLLEDTNVADVTTTNTNPGGPGFGQPDGTVDGADLSYYVEQFLTGCS